MLKGYQGWAGRALVALEAMEACADVLKEYEIVVYLASPVVIEKVTSLQKKRKTKHQDIAAQPVSGHLRVVWSGANRNWN